jgi:hypothetical protein
MAVADGMRAAHEESFRCEPSGVIHGRDHTDRVGKYAMRETGDRFLDRFSRPTPNRNVSDERLRHCTGVVFLEPQPFAAPVSVLFCLCLEGAAFHGCLPPSRMGR